MRGLVFSVLGGLGLGALVYQAWTCPTAMRRLVLDKLGSKFLGATVNLESAQLRLLGGIAVSDLRMARRDDLDKLDFLYVPSGIFYHDKEHLLDGQLSLLKVELHRPRLRLIRNREGRWNLAGILGPVNLDEPVPTLVLRGGTIEIEDQGLAPSAPLLEIKDVSLTMVNDPLPTLNVEGTGRTDVAGPVRLNARIRRDTGEVTASFEADAIPVGPPLVQRLAALAPTQAAHLRQLKGQASLKGSLAFHPDTSPPLTYDLQAELTGGELIHARLPLPLEQIRASLRCVNGVVPLARLSARSGPTTLALRLKDLALPDHTPDNLTDLAHEMDLDIGHLNVSPHFFDPLPADLQEIRDEYAPSGPVSLSYAFRRQGPSGWTKHWVIKPEGMKGAFHEFAYPVEGVAGVIDLEMPSDHNNRVTLDLAGRASGQPVTLKGRIEGPKSVSAVAIDIEGSNLPLDEKLRQAISEKIRGIASPFHPTGLANFKAYLRRTRGHREFANRFLIDFHHAALRYDLFPYPLENVTGFLDVEPDHWEFRDFHGTHKGGEFWVSGTNKIGARVAGRGAREDGLLAACGLAGHQPHSQAAPGNQGEAEPAPAPRPLNQGEDPSRAPNPVPRLPNPMRIVIQGNQVLLDEEFVQALAPPDIPGRAPLQKTWRTLALSGRMDFAAEVLDQPGRPQDIDVAVTVRGCAMLPQFFPYALDQVGGTVHYTRDHVYLADLRARHGAGLLAVPRGQVILKPGGGFQARLDKVLGRDVRPDLDFLRALPPCLARGLEPLKIRDDLQVETDLVIDAPPENGGPPLIWWDGGVRLQNAALVTGVEWSGVRGQVCCCGQHNGRQLEGVLGNVTLEQGSVLGQPLRNLHARLEIDPDTPDTLRLRDLKADYFGGVLGGEGRLEFGPWLRYDLVLKALQVQLEQFGRHNLKGAQADLQGAVQGGLHLSGEGADLSGLKGHGRIDVPSGKLYHLHPLLDLIKAFGLRFPDRTAFEQAHVVFAIDGPQVQVQRLDLYGNAISLRGQGTLNLDGTNLNLDFNADWARIGQVLPAGINDIPRALSDQLLKVKVRGKLGDVRYEKELVPGVYEPIKKIFTGDP